MAYDPIRAHEYYMNYRKKGLLKGRKRGTGSSKKGSSKRTSQKKESLTGLRGAGLNDVGMMQWSMRKKELQTEMNAALAKATTPEEKSKVRQEYQNKALAELQKMKSDPNFARATKAKAASSKGSGGSSSKGGSSKSGSGSAGSSGSSGHVRVSSKTPNYKSASVSAEQQAQEKATKTEQYRQQKSSIEAQIETLKDQLSSMTDEQKATLKEELNGKIKELKAQLRAKKYKYES